MPRGWYFAKSELVDLVVVWSCRKPSGYPVGVAVVHVDEVRSGRVPNVLTWEVWKMLKKPVNGAGTASAIPSVDWDDLSRQLPNLYAFLTQDEWEPGKPREPGAILIFNDRGQLKGMLKDKDNERCVWFTARGLLQLLEVANEKVVDDQADWRADKQVRPAGKKLK